MTALAPGDVLTWDAPPTLAARATVAIVPGRGESPRVYERLGRRLAGDAYRTHAVLAPSAAPEAALDQLERLAATAEPGTPFVLVGSDAGAAFAAHAVAVHRLRGVAALVLAGLPAAGVTAPDGATWDAELEIRTGCPTHRARISDAGVTAAELFADVPAEWTAPDIAPRLDVPVLGLHGRVDALSPVAGARAWYATVPRAELVTFAGGRHDILNDQMHRTVAASLVLFLERLRGGADLAPIAYAEAVRP